MVLNLFVAILLTNFGEHEVSDEMQDARLLLDNVKFFSTYMSKETGKAELRAERAEKRWANLPDKTFKPRVFAKWLKLATKVKAKLEEEQREGGGSRGARTQRGCVEGGAQDEQAKEGKEEGPRGERIRSGPRGFGRSAAFRASIAHPNRAAHPNRCTSSKANR